MAVLNVRTGTTRRLLAKCARDSRAWDMEAFLSESGVRLITFLNAHAVNMAYRDESFARVLLGSSMLLRDGIGVRLALAIFGFGRTENLNGTDLITRMLGQWSGKKLMILGSSADAISKCRAALEKCDSSFRLAFEHGFHDRDFYRARCAEFEPDVVLLCMGMPKQEYLAGSLLRDGFRGLVVCGGGWVDFYSGNKPRAPRWVRALRAEWLFRLFAEPRRLGKRYTIDLFVYFWIILTERFRSVRVPQTGPG